MRNLQPAIRWANALRADVEREIKSARNAGVHPDAGHIAARNHLQTLLRVASERQQPSPPRRAAPPKVVDGGGRVWTDDDHPGYSAMVAECVQRRRAEMVQKG